MGGEKYIGTPAPTKPEAQQVVASVANASLPPVCAAGRGRREGYHVGFTNVFVSLTHTHTHRHTHTDTHTHTHMHTHTHSLLQVHLSVIWLSTTPTSPICSSSPLRYPPSPSYLMASPPSTPTTPIPSELAMATTPGDHAHYPTWLHPSCHCRYGCTHTRGDLLSLVLSHARPHPMTNTVNIPSAYMHAISHNHITICRIHVSVVLITKNCFEYHVVHLHTCNSVTCM